jgi:hypothetical protein
MNELEILGAICNIILRFIGIFLLYMVSGRQAIKVSAGIVSKMRNIFIGNYIYGI